MITYAHFLTGPTPMLALSIVAPNGANIAAGRKTLEIRSWRPPRLPLRDLLIVENRIFLTGKMKRTPTASRSPWWMSRKCMPGSHRSWRRPVPADGPRTYGPGMSRMCGRSAGLFASLPGASFTKCRSVMRCSIVWVERDQLLGAPCCSASTTRVAREAPHRGALSRLM